MQLEVGDVLFVHGTDLISRGIEWAESKAYDKVASQFSHVAMYIGANHLIEAQGFRRHAIGIYPITEYAYVTVKRYNGLTDWERMRLVFSAIGELEDDYSYRMIRVLLNRYLWRRKIAYRSSKEVECAQFLGRLFNNIGWPVTDDDTTGQISPASLWESPHLSLIGTFNTRELIMAGLIRRGKGEPSNHRESHHNFGGTVRPLRRAH